MFFGSFAENNIFHVEKALQENPVGRGVCKVEFIARADRSAGEPSSIYLIEAKSSIPRQSDIFFMDIHTKMIHSLTLWLTTIHGRHPELEPYLPENLKSLESVALIAYVTAKVGKLAMTTAERLRQEGWQKGKQEGKQEGGYTMILSLVNNAKKTGIFRRSYCPDSKSGCCLC